MNKSQDERIARMKFGSVYPLYLAKVEKKGRSKAELDQVIEWLCGYNAAQIQELAAAGVSFEEFFAKATLPKNVSSITGVVCGIRVEDIENKLTQQVRYLDKLVDELAKNKKMEKILRAE